MVERLASAAERFVGRTRELGELASARAAAAAGQGRVVVISGEAGVGKSRFCDELIEHARGDGLRTVLAHCWVDGGAPPLWPWQPILQELSGARASELLGHERPDAAGGNRPQVSDDRFERFTAVTESLAATCTETPVCLVIDDVHAADAGTLLLVRFVARQLHQLPLLLVLVRRDGEPAPDRHEARLLDEIEQDAVLVGLRSFDDDETRSFLDAHGLGSLDRDLQETLHRVTRGNPLFLRRIAALGPPDGRRAVPAGLRVAIDEALTRLEPGCRQLVRLSAVLGPAPSVSEAARLTGSDPAALLDAVDAATGAGLVSPDGPDRFRFTHELVRSALEAALTRADRLDAHARATLIVAGPTASGSPERLARRAHHALAAAPRSQADADVAVSACQAAAAAMMRSFAYEQADRLLSAAIALHESAQLGATPVSLLMAWAQAALHCGRMIEARDRFDRTASAASQDDDPLLFAEAALGLGGHWVNEHRAPVERARVLQLQRAALDRLPDDAVALRCRLRVRLAAEAVFDGEPLGPVFAALDAARACGDPLALAEALSLTHHVMLNPEHTGDRLPLADELVQLTAGTGHGVLGLMGLTWRAVDLVHLGDKRFVRALEELRERAQALACQSILYIVGVMDTMVHLASGELEQAEAQAVKSYELAEAIGEVDALGYFSAHIMVLRWLQGREDEIVDAANDVANSPTLIKTEFSVRAGAAFLAARTGQIERARAGLDVLAADGLAALPMSSTWLPGMVAIVEAAAVLGDDGVARQAYELMLPFADRPMIASVGVVCLGSTEQALGVAARTFGDLDLAVEHLERATVANAQRRNLPMLTLAKANLATTLLQRDGPGDPERAAGLFAVAIDEAESMGMTRRADEWRAQLPERPAARGVPTGPDDAPPGDPAGLRGVIRKEDGRWIVALDGHRVRVPDLIGMRYLAELLTRPGQHIPALTLASDGTVAGSSPHEVLDAQARAHYERRARELTEELAAAEADHDMGRADKLRLEIDALIDELESATGLAGRTRTFANPTERARTAVRKAIKRALDAIDDANPTLAAQLRATVVTGTTCSYTPARHAPITWSTR